MLRLYLRLDRERERDRDLYRLLERDLERDLDRERDRDRLRLLLRLLLLLRLDFFLGDAERRSWAMPDPDRKDEVLTDEARLGHFRTARDVIGAKVDALALELGVPSA